MVVHDRQPLADAGRAALELALAHERDGDRLAPRQDLADEVLAQAVVALVAELQERLAGVAPGRERHRGRQRRPGALRAVDVERAAQRVQPVGEAEQARARLRQRAPAAVVADGGDGLGRVLGHGDVDAPPRPRTSARSSAPRRRGSRSSARPAPAAGARAARRGALERRARRQRLERDAQAALAEARRVQAARELAQLARGQLGLLGRAVEELGRGGRAGRRPCAARARSGGRARRAAAARRRAGRARCAGAPRRRPA